VCAKRRVTESERVWEEGGNITTVYAIIQTGGKQYKVEVGDEILVEKLEAEPETEVSFDVLMVGDGETVTIGKPLVEGVKATGKVKEHGKAKKVIVFKYKAKKNIRKKRGHRQPFTKVEITAIG